MNKTLAISLEKTDNISSHEKNTLSALFAIPLSLFSLAVAVVFSESALIVSSVWILESTILAYFSGKVGNKNILIGSLVLLIIGIIRLIPFFDTVEEKDWFALIPLSIIAGSLFFGVRTIFRGSSLANFYDIVHIIGIFILGGALIEIIPHTTTGWSLLGGSLFLGVSTWIYSSIKSRVLSIWIGLMSCGYFFTHLVRIDYLSLSLFPLLVQISALSIALFATWIYFSYSVIGRASFIFGSIFTLLITSIYVNEITDNVFAVTIYLTIISTFFILRGIHKEKPYLRTIGLYIGTIVLLKIIFFDLWVGVDNLIIRVFALMISGGVMIALSQIYGARVNRPWSEEFSMDNFSEHIKFSGISDETSLPSDDEIPFSEDIAESLKNVDISNISQVQFLDPTGNIVFSSKRSGILRITLYIAESLKKTLFAPDELLYTFQRVEENIRSSLPKKDLETILVAIESWIHTGGTVKIEPKSSK